MTTRPEYHDDLARKLNTLEEKVDAQAREIATQAHKIDSHARKIVTQAVEIDTLSKQVDMQAGKIGHLKNMSQQYAHVKSELENLTLKYRNLVAYNSRQPNLTENVELELQNSTADYQAMDAEQKSLDPEKDGVTQRFEKTHQKSMIHVGSLLH